jgi:hypothetical protein
MGKTGFSRRSAAQSATHGSSTRRPRGDGRLDPVRWRRPGRGTLLRLAAVAALLATAAAVLWSPPEQPCDQAAGVASGAPDRPRPSGGTTTEVTHTAPDTGGRTAPAGETASAGGTAPAGGPAVPEGSVGVPVRLADPTGLGLVRPGNHVDLLKIDDEGGPPTAVAGSVLVLQVTGANDPTTGGLLLALTPQQATQAVATSRQGFAIVIRPG